MIGKTFSHYTILRKLGQGGMGLVYLAHDTWLDRRVALKSLPEVAQRDPVARERFIREARSAAAIDHPYVCKIYEAGEFEGEAFIAMEFVEGDTLEYRLRAGPLPWTAAVGLAVEIAEALSRAHEKGVIHRDLKPSNVMLMADGHAKVLDFGLAKRVASDDQETVTGSALTQAGTVLGTPSYMSPEQLRARALDHRTDIFSLGIILYQMLSGIHPFRKASSMETGMAILSERPSPVSRFCQDCPARLDQVVGRMLAKEPSQRYDSVRQLLEDLRVSELGRSPVATAVRPSLASVAVLPFVSMGAAQEPEQEYFADGITEDIITQLSKIFGIKVIARTSVMRYKNSQKDLSDIGRELGVRHVLEGSVQRLGNRVRIRSGLVDTESSRQLWGEVYDRQLEDIFAIQTEVSRHIADALSLTLSPIRKATTEKGPASIEAYQRYLRGRYFLNKLTPDSIRKALDYLEGALEIDDRYAQAWAAISICYAISGHFDYIPRNEAFPKAKNAAQQALDLDDSVNEAHASMGLVHLFHDWDWQAADRSFRRAIELNDNWADVHTYYSWALCMMERFDEALSEARRALEIDPLSPFVSSNLGWVLIQANRCDEALEQFWHTLEIDPNYFPVQSLIGLAYVGKGMYDQAIERLRQFSWRKSMLGLAYALAGRHDEARAILAEITDASRGIRTPPSEIAQIYLYLGEREQAAHWLDRAYEERDYMLAANKPQWAPARTDPLVVNYLRRIGLAP